MIVVLIVISPLGNTVAKKVNCSLNDRINTKQLEQVFGTVNRIDCVSFPNDKIYGFFFRIQKVSMDLSLLSRTWLKKYYLTSEVLNLRYNL